MMAMLPYGANILIKSKTSTINDKFSVGTSDYITSTKEISEIKYEYTEINGNLVGISTNLQIVSWNKNTNPPTFTLSNSNIFGTNTEPYISLLCNNVNIPISFLDHDGTGNKWSSTDYTSYDNKIRLKGYYEPSHIDVAKYYTISWSTSSEQLIFIERDKSGGGIYREYYACDAFYDYLDNDNKIQHGNSTIYSSFGSPPNSGYITIPRLDGTSSSLKNGNNIIDTKKFINYFALGLQVHINDGYSVYKADTVNYIDGTNNVYANDGIFRTISTKEFLENSHGIPVKYDNLKIKWNSDFFYKTQEENYYISPSTSQIKFDWDFKCCEYNCQCDCNCQCQCDCQCDCNCQCQCDCEYCNICDLCNCNCNNCDCNCDCQCNNCNCQCEEPLCECECETGTCEGCQCNQACDCQCQCQCECDGGGGSEIDYIEVTGDTRGQFLISWQGKDRPCNCAVYKGNYSGDTISGGGVLIYGSFSGNTGIESIDIYGPWYSSQCSITSNYTIHYK